MRTTVIAHTVGRTEAPAWPDVCDAGALVVISIAGRGDRGRRKLVGNAVLASSSLGAPRDRFRRSAFVALVGFMFVGRLAGDRLVDRFGERAVYEPVDSSPQAGMFFAGISGCCPARSPGLRAAGLRRPPPSSRRRCTGPISCPVVKRPGTGLTAVTWLNSASASLARLVLIGVIPARQSFGSGSPRPIAGLMAVALAGTLHCAAPTISIVNTPATIECDARNPLTPLSRSVKRNRATTATTATPQAVQMPYAMPAPRASPSTTTATADRTTRGNRR